MVRLDLDERLERRGRLAFENALLGPAAARLFVSERHRLNSANEIGKRRVQHEVLEGVAVRGRDELHAALGDRPRGAGFLLGSDLIDDDDLRHVILDGLDHHGVLQRRRGDLHAPRAADARVWNVAVACDLVRGVHDDDALPHLVREHARDLAQKRGLPDAGATEEQDAAPGLDDVADDFHRPIDRAPDAQREPDDLACAIAEGADAMERSLDARAVVPAELPDAGDYKGEVLGGDFALGEDLLPAGKARLGQATEVHHDLQKTVQPIKTANALDELRGKGVKNGVELVGREQLSGHVIDRRSGRPRPRLVTR